LILLTFTNARRITPRHTAKEDSMGTDDADRGTLTVEETAARLGISRTLAYELARTGRLPVPVLRLGRRVMVSRTALERVLAAERIDHREACDDLV
jgi:excisionase family DNA binding protein